MNALTFEIAAGLALVVFGGNYWYCRKNGQTHNWKRGLIMAGVAFVLTVIIGIAGE